MISEFETLWGRTISFGLAQLIEFQESQSAFECYSQGFGIATDYRDGLESWSDDPQFLDKLFPFAQANGSGSFYAFWDSGEDYLSMHLMPIVVFGDEGGQWVVAESFDELLQLLSYDTEITVLPDDVYFYKDEDDDKNEDAQIFREWLGQYFKHLPIVTSNEQADMIIKNAQQKYQAKFNDWLSGFGIEVSEYNLDE
ncbi:MAG: hypothetical protein Q4B79_08720 [Moraxella sp.]|uniref:hypothetical protein n=1 Tax=Moraxella sp. TaxID=479 RepID=UPI0026DBA33A|nr:hypothetical protein [Moraxella sp.]MDO4451021.1 hypothetical protein [Moraxella sp.]